MFEHLVRTAGKRDERRLALSSSVRTNMSFAPAISA
jgi:hypothetical protein